MAQEVGALRVSLSLDSADFTKNLTAIDTKLKAFKAEINASTKSGTGFAKGLDELKTKSDILSKALETQKVKVAELKRRYDESVEANGKNSQETDKAAAAYNKAVAEMNKMENQLKGITAEIERQTNPLRKLQDTLQQTSQKLKDVGQSMVDVGKNMSMKVTAPIAALGGVMIKTAIDFESSMSKVSAISGATGVSLEKLEKQARDLGATTQFSASEVASAMEYQALAGWEVNQILAATPGLLNVAAAGNLNLAQASDIVTDSMSMFQMKAEEATRASDVFAYAQANSNMNIQQLGEALKYAGASANAAGMDIEQTSAILGVLADNGLKGSVAGTTLNSMLRDLKKRAKDGKVDFGEFSVALYDTEGNMRDLTSVMADLEDGLKGMSTEQRDAALASAFQVEAMKGANIILAEGTDKVRGLETSLYNANGAAEKMAKTMQDNAAGKIKEMKSAFEELSIMFANHVLPMFTAMIEKITEWIRKFGELDPSTQKFIIGLAGVSAAVGPVLIGLGSLIKSIGSIAGVVSMASGAIAGAGGLGAALTALATNPITLTIAGIAALGYGVTKLVKHFKEDAIPAVDLFGDEVSESTQEAVGSFLELNDKATVALNEMTWGLKTVTAEMSETVVSSFGEMSGQIVSKLEESKVEAVATMQELFSNSVAITEEEQQKILESVEKGYGDRINRTKENEERIQEILKTASENKRTLTLSEKEEINRIQQEMLHTGISVLTENEVEQRVIFERMKQQATEISAQQAAEVVRNSVEQKDKVIAEAEEKYNKAIAFAIQQRDELGTISEEEANLLISEAERQKNETIKQAEEQHLRIVEEAQKQAEEHVDKVNWETGEVLSKWEYLKNNASKKWQEMKRSASEWWNKTWTDIQDFATKIKDYPIKKFEELRSEAEKKFEEIKEKVTKPVEEAKDKVFGFIEDIKGFFSNLKLKLPKIEMPPLPRFKLEGSFSLNPPSVPKLSVDWYAKGAVFTKPTIFNTPYGLKGFGEAGPEAALPLTDKVLGTIGRMIAQTMPHMETVEQKNLSTTYEGAQFSFTGPVYMRSEEDIRMLARELDHLAKQRKRGGGIR